MKIAVSCKERLQSSITDGLTTLNNRDGYWVYLGMTIAHENVSTEHWFTFKEIHSKGYTLISGILHNKIKVYFGKGFEFYLEKKPIQSSAQEAERRWSIEFDRKDLNFFLDEGLKIPCNEHGERI